MARDIKTLLNKKGWTGQEVGQALMASLIHEVKHLGKDVKPLFTQAELDRMENSLKSRPDYVSYGVYRSIYSAVIDGFNKGQGLYQQFYNGFYRNLMLLQQATKIEQSLKEADNRPLIMTQSQYDRIAAHVLAEKRSVPVSFRLLIFQLLETYLNDYQSDLKEPTSTPEAIKSALEACKKEPVANNRILENYNADTGDGYYQLPDGRRSDQMEQEEWENTLRQEWIKGYKLIIDGVPASPEETIKRKNIERQERGFQLLYEGIERAERELELLGLSLPEGMTGAEFMEHLERYIVAWGEYEVERTGDLGNVIHQLLHGKNFTQPEWLYYQDPPADLNKFDVLVSLIDRYQGNLASRLQDGKIVKEISETAAFTEFRKDYPALFSALKDEIERLLPQAKGLKVNQYNKDISTYGELADRGSAFHQNYLTLLPYDIAEYYLTQPGNTYGKRNRALWSGIAIVQPPFSQKVDEQGDYLEYSDPLSLFMSIDAISESQEHREELITFREVLIKPSLRYLYAYNSVVDLIGKAYEIDGMEALKQKLHTFESQLSGLNGSIYWLYTYAYGDPEEKSRKRALIKELFLPIDPEELKPTPEAIARTQKEVNALGLTVEAGMKLKTFDALIGSLMEKGV